MDQVIKRGLRDRYRNDLFHGPLSLNYILQVVTLGKKRRSPQIRIKIFRIFAPNRPEGDPQISGDSFPDVGVF